MNQPIVDIGVLTIRDDEFRAVLQTFARDHDIHKGRYREYTLRTADAGQGARYHLAILRQIEQGNGEAQEAARLRDGGDSRGDPIRERRRRRGRLVCR